MLYLLVLLRVERLDWKMHADVGDLCHDLAEEENKNAVAFVSFSEGGVALVPITVSYI